MPDLEGAAACVQMLKTVGGGDPQSVRLGAASGRGRCVVDHRTNLQVTDAAACRLLRQETLERYP